VLKSNTAEDGVKETVFLSPPRELVLTQPIWSRPNLVSGVMPGFRAGALRPTVVNTVGLTTLELFRYPINTHPTPPPARWCTLKGFRICVAGLQEREFFIDDLLFRIHFIIVMIRWTGPAPWQFEFPFPGSLTSAFLGRAATSLSQDRLSDLILPRATEGVLSSQNTIDFSTV
jgi:hypothetical protein